MDQSDASKRSLKSVSLLWATVDQAKDLARLHADLMDTPWSAESFAGSLSHPGSTSFVARTGTPKETVGFIIGQLAADEAELLTLCVVKDWQRLGLGRHLVEALVRACKKAEVKRLFLEVAADNTAATALYKALGFEETGRRAGYYVRAGQPSVDALLMSRSIT